MSTAQAIDSIRDAALQLQRAEPGPDWLMHLRRRGLDGFLHNGFPGGREENWKYTRLAPVARRRFVLPGAASAELPADAFAALPGPRLVFVNGRLDTGLSSAKATDGLALHGLSEASATGEDPAEGRLGSIADADLHRFTHLSHALLQDGVVIDVAAGTSVADPVYLLFLTTPGEAPRIVNPRVFVRAREQSDICLIEHHVGASGGGDLINLVTELDIAASARVRYYQLQECADDACLLSGLHARQARDSHLTHYSISLAGRMVRNDLHCRLDGSGAGVDMYGLYLAGDRRHVDNHTRVEHVATHTRSTEDYKGVLHGRGRAVFNGRAHIHPGARGSEAQQVNDNLLLSREAEVDTKPELEIYNDDVKCTHGATAGQLDEQALFYLRSRGIGAETAKVMLTFAFAEAVLGNITVDAVRERVEQTVIAMLPDSDKIREFV